MFEAPLAPAGDDAPSSRPRQETLDLSILIVTWNSERFIDRCLRSIPAACEGLRYEVVVHDNASSDATVAHIHDAQILRSETNAGFAAGTNRALRHATGRYLFLLNPDCELEPRALTELLQFIEAHPEIDAVAPLLVDDDGQAQREFQLRRLPTLRTLAVEVLLVDKLFPRNRATASYRYRDLDLREPRRIEQPAAAALLIRRAAIEAIGPFDERFKPAWFEDVDFCRRFADAGREIWVVPSSRVRHFGGASLEHLGFERFAEVWYRNMWLYARKWMRPGEVEALRWMIIAGMLLRCAALVVGRRPRGISRREAYRAFVRVLKKALDRWDE